MPYAPSSEPSLDILRPGLGLPTLPTPPHISSVKPTVQHQILIYHTQKSRLETIGLISSTEIDTRKVTRRDRENRRASLDLLEMGVNSPTRP